MQRQSYQVKTVLEKKGARKKTSLAFKDSLENPLSRLLKNFPFKRMQRVKNYACAVWPASMQVKHMPPASPFPFALFATQIADLKAQ